MSVEFEVFVGVDLAAAAPHVALAVDSNGVKGKLAFRHSAEEIRSFVEWAVGFASSKERVVVALEAPHGPVVEELLSEGIAVYHLNPKQLDRFRESENVGGAKDDERDARLLAQRLRTDQSCYRRVEPADPIYVRLREASREREALKKDLGVQANRLREVLYRINPALLSLSAGADEPWLWDLLELYPTPKEWKRLKRGKLREILKKRRIRRLGVNDLMEALSGQQVKTAPGIVEAAKGKVPRLARTLKVLHAHAREIEGELSAALEEAQEELPGQRKQRDAAIILSMPGVGIVVSATLLGEASRALCTRDYAQLRSIAGVAPVTKASGKRSRGRAKVSMRYACNSRLRNAVHYMAGAAIARDEGARAHYEKLRERGHNHSRSLRQVGDRLLKIMIGALRSGKLYDPTLQRGTYSLANAEKAA